MSLIKCEIHLILTWSTKQVTPKDNRTRTFAKTDTKLYVLLITLSTQDNTKLLQQSKSEFKRTINWKR